MRRSAAPSLKTDIKRARFLPHIIKSASVNDKENKCISVSLNIPSTKPETSNPINNTKHETTIKIESVCSNEHVRSNEDVLDLICEADSSTIEDIKKANVLSANEDNYPKNFRPNIFKLPIKSNTETPGQNETVEEYSNLSNCVFCTKLEASLFNVVWCKRSGKKHKIWEGDGFLIVKSRSAVLKDLTGKVLDKGIGYKLKETESLEEGSKFFIGSKECEIQYKISEEECQSGKFCKCSSTKSPVREPEKKLPVKIHKPC